MRFVVMIRRTKTGYSADVPDLPGCIATARTLRGVRTRIKSAIEMHLEMMMQTGEPMPKPRQRFEFTVDPAEMEELCTWVNVGVPQPVWPGDDAMTAKRGQGEIDWRVDSDFLVKIIRAAPVESVRKIGLKTIIDKLGIDGLIELLTPEQRRELAKRMESEKSSSRPK
jgi:predicted RNase H-like HicB family nuclease